MIPETSPFLSLSSSLSLSLFLSPPLSLSVYIYIYIKTLIFPKDNEKGKKNYIGILSVRWKLRYNNHVLSFSHKHLKNQIALSKHFGSLRNRRLNPKIQGKMSKRSTTFSCFDGRSNLCLEEKIQIMIYIDPFNQLNRIRDVVLLLDVGIEINLDWFREILE